jgi:hypothetical protein
MVAIKISQRQLTVVSTKTFVVIGNKEKDVDFPERPRREVSLESLDELRDGFGADTVSLIDKILPLEERIRR